MGRKIIDLSISIEPGLPGDPEMMIPKIDYIDHVQGAGQMEMFFPGLIILSFFSSTISTPLRTDLLTVTDRIIRLSKRQC